MPNVDYGKWESFATINPPGGLEGPTLASAATIAITHPVHKVSGTTQITTITPPFTGFIGRILLIATAAWTTATGGNVAKAFTAVADEGTHWYYDGALWYPIMGD